MRQTLSGLAWVHMGFRRGAGLPDLRERVERCRFIARPGRGRPAAVESDGERQMRGPVFVEPILTMPFDRHSLAELRTLLAISADGVGLGAHRVEDLLVVATELATNAVRHAGGSGVLRLWLGGGALHCRVTDEGPGLADPDRAGEHLVPPTSDEGRGLWLARELSDDLTVVVGQRGTSATATFYLS